MGFAKGEAEKMVLDAFHRRPYKGVVSSVNHVGDVKPAVAMPKQPTKFHLGPEGKQLPIGNGGIAENYYWTQSLNDLSIFVDVPAGVKGKDVKCCISPTKLALEVQGLIICGQFEDLINASESVWTISRDPIGGNSQVVITLEKVKKTWWKSAIVGHPEIDTTKVDSSQGIDEYDRDTQAAIRKIMYEQRQGRVPSDV